MSNLCQFCAAGHEPFHCYHYFKDEQAKPCTACQFCLAGNKPINGRHYHFDAAVSATHSYLCSNRWLPTVMLEADARVKLRGLCASLSPLQVEKAIALLQKLLARPEQTTKRTRRRTHSKPLITHKR